MARRLTSMNIEEQLIDEAKRFGLNMGELLEDALKKKFNKKDEVIEIDNLKSCWFCDREGDLERSEDIIYQRKKPNNLLWLSPDERWICNRCLNMRLPKKRSEVVFP